MSTPVVLVFGSNGTIGSRVVKHLMEDKEFVGKVMVKAQARDPNKAPQFKDVEVVVADLDDESSLKKITVGVDRIFISPPLVPGTNKHFENLVKVAKENGVKHIVKLSGMGTDAPNPITIGKMHRATELIIEQSGINWTFIRPNSFMQNFITFFGDSIRNRNTFYIPQGEGKVSYIDAEDVAIVAATILVDPAPHVGKEYTLTGPEAVSAGEVAKLISDAVGHEVTYIDTPPEAAKQAMLQYGMPEPAVNNLMELYDLNKNNKTSLVTDCVEMVAKKKPTTMKEFVEREKKAFTK